MAEFRLNGGDGSRDQHPECETAYEGQSSGLPFLSRFTDVAAEAGLIQSVAFLDFDND